MMACLSDRVKKRFPIIKFIYEHIDDKDKEKIINEKGPMKKTLLHFACENREFEVARYLVSLPTVDINSVDEDSRTALMISILVDFNEIIKILLDHPSIDVTIRDKNNKTAYDIAISRSFDEELVKLIQDKMQK